MQRLIPQLRMVVAVATMLCAGIMIANAQSLTWLGTLGGDSSEARGVSNNAVVVGVAYNASNNPRAFRWTNGLMQDIGTLGGHSGEAYGVSADGAVVVGRAKNASNQWRAFRWTQASGIQDLGTLGGSYSEARGVSADGSVVVGTAYNAGNQWRAFRWASATGMQELGTPGGYWSAAYGVSADGTVVVGWADEDGGDNYRAFRWTSATGMRELSGLISNYSWAYGVSADGNVIVGMAYNVNGYSRAFRWTPAMVMEDLGTLGSDYSWAYGVSADGTVVVGWADDVSSYSRACCWNQATGMQDLNTLYASLLTDGSYLATAYAISPDGRYIVGKGYNASTGRDEGFLLDTAVATRQIAGNVLLQDFGGDITQVPIAVQLRPTGLPPSDLVVYLDAQGNYVIPDVEPNVYDIAFKASHWLRVVVQGVDVTGGHASGVDVSLINGDIDGDNEVTLFDFGALVAGFGSVPGDSNWNPDADLDADEEVTLFDFGILVRNFGAVGDD